MTDDQFSKLKDFLTKLGYFIQEASGEVTKLNNTNQALLGNVEDSLEKLIALTKKNNELLENISNSK